MALMLSESTVKDRNHCVDEGTQFSSGSKYVKPHINKILKAQPSLDSSKFRINEEKDHLHAVTTVFVIATNLPVKATSILNTTYRFCSSICCHTNNKETLAY